MFSIDFFGVLTVKMAGKLPNDDTGGDRNVQRMFRAELWNFQTPVASIDNALADAFDFVAEYEGGFGRERKGREGGVKGE